MTKLTLKYKRLLPEESISLLKDTKTKRRLWRHRYSVRKGGSALSKQKFKDYMHKKFKTILEFRAFIENLPKKKRYKND